MDKSLWIESCKNKSKEYNKLEGKINTEICIVGAGLTGLTCGYYLSKLGRKVIILDKDKICNHTSGNTTAKITSQHGLFYKYLIDSQGEDKAKQYLKANEKAIRNIEKIVQEENIDCEFEKQNSYIYAENQSDVEKIQQEIKALKSIGYESEFVEKVNIKRKNYGAIKFKNQAQFNPCKYAIGLANVITSNNGLIFENSKVIDIKRDGQVYKTLTDEGEITSKYVILASHYPIINAPGFYFMKMYQQTSYLIGIETKEKLFEGMYINAGDNVLSLRIAKDENKNIVLIGGMEHKTGAKIDLSNNYNVLEKIAKEMYPDAIVKYRWNTEDCIPLDKIPYIGEFSTLMPNVYLGTGYKKWGMTNSNVAANIIVDKINGKENRYEDVFKSTRLKPIKNYEELGNMVKEVSYSLIINKFKETNYELENLKNNEGKIIEIENNKIGAYKDENGKVYLIKPICTHLGCELTWNNLDKTWDCPCHGSRFDYTGKNIYDPAIKNLERLN